MALVTTVSKGGALSVLEMDGNLNTLDLKTQDGWSDLVSPLMIEGVPLANAPEYVAFGPSGLRRELAFGIGDYAFAKAFHINHDVKPGGKALCHIHWSTNGVNTAPIRWEFQVSRALGHQQAYFTAETSYFVTQPAWAGAWRHMIAEVAIEDALTLTEPDELVLVTVRRVTNGATDNTDLVFGLTVDFHYETDRSATPNRAPNFYA